MQHPSQSAPDQTPPRLDLARDALLVDFDGTLIDIAPRPDAVRVPDGLLPLLDRLHSGASKAVAVVSGRSLAELEHFLPGFAGALIGSHGGERRGSAEVTLPEGLDRLHDAVRQRAAAEGLLAEIKTHGAALHFREAPEREAVARDIAGALAAEFPGFTVQPAKMAFELKPAGATKDRALADLMSAPPFADRRPVYLGDDATDEPALDWVLRQGGVAVKVGDGHSVAPHRLAGPAEVLQWLRHALDGA